MSNRFHEKCAAVAGRMSEIKVVPVLAVESIDEGLRICRIFSDAGIPCAEITFRTKAAADVIAAVTKEIPDMLVGAGTVLTEADLRKAVDAGASFAVAPGCNPTVISAAIAMDFPFIPGVATPSDVERALELGCRVLKFFPAEAVGGLKLLKAILAPYKHLGVRFMPTGGITLENMGSYLELKEVAAVGGTWLAKPEDLKAGRWDIMEKAAKDTAARLV